MQRNMAELMYGWIHATCHQEVNVFLSALRVSYNACSTWFFASEICRGCLEWSGLCVVALLRGVSCFLVTRRTVSVLFTGEQSSLGEQGLP